VILLAGTALLVTCVCVPPIEWHDGLPAWAPELGRTEARVGYQRLAVIGGDTISFLGGSFLYPSYSVGYLTPGVRVGLGKAPLAAEVGLTSVVLAGDGYFSTLAGPEFGLGYSSPDVSLMFRPSFYFLDVYSDRESGTTVQTSSWSQLSMLVGTGYRAKDLLRNNIYICDMEGSMV
jgi:hypothetical protein